MFVHTLYIERVQPADDEGHLRIGELSRRVGVSPELLRAWERRYGLLSPSRTAGGYRLYGEEDERRIRRMLDHLKKGVSAAEAARLAGVEQTERAPDHRVGAPTPRTLGGDLRRTLDELDDAGAHAALDVLLGAFPLETVLHDAVLPYLHELGERWERGEASVAQEHFASVLLRGRLLALARGWGSGGGPRALLACLPGNQHDLALICFGLALRGHGWRITFLGPDTPLATIAETARLLGPALIVVTAALPEHATDVKEGLSEVARVAPVAIAGGGASPTIAEIVGARYLGQDPVTAAATVAGPTGPSQAQADAAR